MKHNFSMDTKSIEAILNALQKMESLSSEEANLVSALCKEIEIAKQLDKQDDATAKSIFMMCDDIDFEESNVLIRKSQDETKIEYEVHDFVGTLMVRGVFQRADLKSFREDAIKIRNGDYGLPF